MERPAGIEPVVFCLEGSSSAIELRTLEAGSPIPARSSGAAPEESDLRPSLFDDPAPEQYQNALESQAEMSDIVGLRRLASLKPCETAHRVGAGAKPAGFACRKGPWARRRSRQDEGLSRPADFLLQRLRPTDARGWQKRVAVGGRAALAAFAGIALASCGTVQPTTRTIYQPVDRVVVASCLPKDLPEKPKLHTDAELKAVEGPTRYVMTAQDRADAIAWIEEVGPVIQACR